MSNEKIPGMNIGTIEQLREARDLLSSATDAPWKGFTRRETYEWHTRKDAFLKGVQLPSSALEVCERDLVEAKAKIAQLLSALSESEKRTTRERALLDWSKRHSGGVTMSQVSFDAAHIAWLMNEARRA